MTSTRTERLWFTRCPVPTASGLAADRGWLAREFAGDDVTVGSLQEDAPHDVDRHFDHDLTGLIREGGNVPALWARSRGPHTRLIGITWVDEYQAILALPDRGVAAPEELRGRRVAVPAEEVDWVDFRRAMALRGFDTALRLAGLALDDVTAVDLRSTQVHRPLGVPGRSTAAPEPYRDELAALRAGEVDAIYVKGAHGQQVARDQRLVEVVDLGAHPDPSVRVNNGTPRTITAHVELLERSPEVVARYLAALLRAATWAQAHPGELAGTIATETGADAAAVLAGYAADDLRPRLDGAWLTALAEQKEFLLRAGLLAGDFDVAAWAAPEPLAAARRLLDHTTPTER